MLSPPGTFPSKLKLSHVPELDGLRGIAAFAVFCHHLFYTSVPHPEQGNWVVSTICSVTVAGAYGVDLFFVLSGFLITSILLLDRGQPNYYWNFYWKRALRIFPLYIVSLVCLAAFLPSTRPYVLLSALFIANFAQVFHVPVDGPFWTLAIEEQFYLIWPQFAERLTVDRLQRLALGVVGTGLVLRLIAALLGHHQYRVTFFHCDGLALGAFLACQQVRRASSSGHTRFPQAGRVQNAMVLKAGIFMSVLPMFFPVIDRMRMAAEALQILGISLVSYWAVAAAVRHTGSPLLRVLRSRVLMFFGLISYALYMSHLYILKLYDHVIGQPQATEPMRLAIRFCSVLAATLLVCVFSRYAVELPAMKLRKFFLRPS